MKAFSSFITKLDIVGQEYNFELNENKRHQTLPGAFLTSIIIITSLVYGFMFGQEVYLRENPSVNIRNEYLDISKIYLKDYPLLFQFYINSKLSDNYIDYFDIRVSSLTIDYEYNLQFKTKKQLVNCLQKQKDFKAAQSNVTDQIFEKYTFFCIDFDEDEYFQNKLGTQNSTYYTISISFCDYTDDTRNCKATPKFKSFNHYLVFAFVDNYIDSYNYENPISQYLNSVTYGFSYNVLKTFTYNFQNDLLASNSGWLLDDIINHDNVVFSGLDVDTNLSVGESSNNLMNIIIQSNNIRKKTSRSYLKVQELAAKVGGIVNVLYILIYIISYHYIRFKYIIWVRENSIELINDFSGINNNVRVLNINDFSNKRNINQVKFININNSNIIDKSNNSRFQLNNEIVSSFNLENNHNKPFNSNKNINSNTGKNISNKENVPDIVIQNYDSNINPTSNNFNNKNLNMPTSNNNCDSFKIQCSKKEETKIKDDNNEKNEERIVKANISNNKSRVINISNKNKDLISKISRINEDLSSFNKSNSILFSKDTSFLKSYFRYLLYCISCCCSKNEINLLFKREINKVYSFLSIKNFNYYLINQYNKKFINNPIIL